jgi:hypothetical protein
VSQLTDLPNSQQDNLLRTQMRAVCVCIAPTSPVT